MNRLDPAANALYCCMNEISPPKSSEFARFS